MRTELVQHNLAVRLLSGHSAISIFKINTKKYHINFSVEDDCVTSIVCQNSKYYYVVYNLLYIQCFQRQLIVGRLFVVRRRECAFAGDRALFPSKFRGRKLHHRQCP
jgi:hypothetical protein